MDYTYTILILLLPFLSFLFLGLAGKWLSHRAAGLFGTTVLGVVTVLSYYTAFTYFTADRVDGVFQTLVPVNFVWLPFSDALHFDLGIMLDPISVMMLIVISTVSLMVSGRFRKLPESAAARGSEARNAWSARTNAAYSCP